jgi:hypothetical protein
MCVHYGARGEMFTRDGGDCDAAGRRKDAGDPGLTKRESNGGYLMCGPMCLNDFSFSLQMNSKSSVPVTRRDLTVAVHGRV